LPGLKQFGDWGSAVPPGFPGQPTAAELEAKLAEFEAKRQAERAARHAEREARRAKRAAEREATNARKSLELESYREVNNKKLAKADAEAEAQAEKERLAKGGKFLIHSAEEIEDCMSCRYVWLQVEMDVGDTQIEENVYDAFNQNAIEAQKQPIFYPGVQTMFDVVDDMLGDYMDGYNVNQICENSLLCR
jgi:hypothetical protein